MSSQLVVVLALLAVAFAERGIQSKANLAKHVFGDHEILHNVPRASNDPLGFQNSAFQAVTYSKSCDQGSSYMFQAYEGGLCMKVNNGGPIQSQRIGCNPPADGKTEWAMNIMQFSTGDCSSTPVQTIQQYHNVNDCNAISNDDPFKSFYRMTCVASDANHSPRTFTGLVSAFYGTKDTTCANKPVVVQGIVAGACIKGTTTDAAGNKVASNSSTIFSCADAADLQINVYSGSDNCNGQPTHVPLKVPFPKCAPTEWNSGQHVNEREACVNQAGMI